MAGRPIRTTAKEYWDAHKASYPFHAIAATGIVKPTDKAFKGKLFIYCPLGNGNSMWGFEKEADRDAFCSIVPTSERA